MKKLILASILLINSSVVAAAPIYLSCVIPPSQKGDIAYKFSVTLDEQTRKITHSDEHSGNIFNVEGFFRPAKISYKTVRNTEFKVGSRTSIQTSTSNYEIDRTNLSVNFKFRSEVIDSPAEPGTMESSGKCRVITAPPRKI
jgi:hypothetical protein